MDSATQSLELIIQAHGADGLPLHAGVDTSSTHRVEFWKQYVLANGTVNASILMNAITRTENKRVNTQPALIAYTRGVREAKAIVALRAKREAEEVAAQVRERNAERNRKKREARKRSKQQQA